MALNTCRRYLAALLQLELHGIPELGAGRRTSAGSVFPRCRVHWSLVHSTRQWRVPGAAVFTRGGGERNGAVSLSPDWRQKEQRSVPASPNLIVTWPRAAIKVATRSMRFTSPLQKTARAGSGLDIIGRSHWRGNMCPETTSPLR